MSENPKTFGEVMGRDLSGYKQVNAFFLELCHGLMGFFPALIAATEEVVVCLDKELLVKVAKTLPPRTCKQGDFLMLANIKGSFGFELNSRKKEDAPALHILTESEFERRVKEEERPFKWAPGLVSNYMTKEEFLETLEAAM